MAHKFKEVSRPQTYLVPVGATCDRCGESAGIMGAGRDRVAWGDVSVNIQGTFGLFKADLCRSCSEELRDWIDEGPGPGMRDGTERPEIVET